MMASVDRLKDTAGKQLHNAALPNSEPKLREVFGKLAKHGRILVVVDQPATIGDLPVTVARACGHDVACLPGLAMRRIADPYPGNAKTDARDAYAIADAARTLRHPLRQVDVGDDTPRRARSPRGLRRRSGRRGHPAVQIGSGACLPHPPARERVLGPKVTHPAVLEILSRFGGPAGIRRTSRRKPSSIATQYAPRMGAKPVENILAALDEQTVAVPGTAATDTVLPRLAESLKTVLSQRKTLAARILLGIGDASAFTTSGHLAAYAGIAPVASPDAATTSCSPCFETRPSTSHPHPERLDDKQIPQEHVPLTTVSGIEHGGDGFDLHKLIVVAEHCDAHQSAGDVVVTERVPDYLPGCHQVLLAG